MKKIVSLLVIFVLAGFTALSQSGKERREAAEKKAAQQRSRSLGGQRTVNELKDDKGQGIDPLELRERAGAAGQGTDPDAAGSRGDQDASNGEQNDPPAAFTMTSSEGGSPAILSENKGKGRDGTGNVQRAAPNMAGSPVPRGLALSEKNPNPGNMNFRTDVRQQEEQPQRSGPDRAEAGAKGKGQIAKERRSGQKADQGENKRSGTKRRRDKG